MANIIQINGKKVKDVNAARMSSLAPVESSTTASMAHAVGDYFWLNGTLYEATAAITIGSAISVGTNCKITNMGENLADLKSHLILKSESLNLTFSAESSGKIINASGNIVSANGFHYTDLLQVFFGYINVNYSNNAGAITLRVHGYDSNGNWVRQLWNKAVANNETNTVIIQIDDDIKYVRMNCPESNFSVTITNFLDLKRNSVAVNEDLQTLENITNQIISDERELHLSETPTTETAGTYLYYPMEFVPGQTYFVNVTFSAFASSANRKYSLRTTTAQYTSATYTVQVFAVVDGTNPTIGETYTYTFTAQAKESGAYGHYLCVELNPTTGQEATCNVEVYSLKIEDAQTALNNLAYLTATDIVSLNHDAPLKILNGLKPFGRATTVPLALLHFSDIHAAQTNLERLVQMGESLSANIDDVICTGDMVANNYSATGMDFWNAVDGAENILMVVGNHDLADGSQGYSSDQIGQTVAYQTYFAPYISNWGVTMAGENLTYWYKDYAAKKVRLIGLNYLLTGDASAAQKTWLAARLAEAKTAGLTVVIAEHSPLNSFTEISCNFNIIGKLWGYNEILADIQSAVQDFIDDGGEFACYIAGHSHSDYVGYNSNYPQQICIAVTTAMTSGADNDQRRIAGEKSQDAANVVLVDTVTKTVKLVRIGADMDCYLRGRDLFSIRYTDKTIIAQS